MVAVAEANNTVVVTNGNTNIDSNSEWKTSAFIYIYIYYIFAAYSSQIKINSQDNSLTDICITVPKILRHKS